jgi:hypothetical protein
LGWVELVIEGAFEVEGFEVIEVGILKWFEVEELSPWVDWSIPWGVASFDSNWGLGQLCWSTVKDKGYYLNSSKMG